MIYTTEEQHYGTNIRGMSHAEASFQSVTATWISHKSCKCQKASTSRIIFNQDNQHFTVSRCVQLDAQGRETEDRHKWNIRYRQSLKNGMYQKYKGTENTRKPSPLTATHSLALRRLRHWDQHLPKEREVPSAQSAEHAKRVDLSYDLSFRISWRLDLSFKCAQELTLKYFKYLEIFHHPPKSWNIN